MSEKFKKAVAQQAPAVPVVEQPLEHARQVFGLPKRSGWYRYEGRSQRLLDLKPGSTRNVHLLPNFKGALKLLDQAERQVQVANGTPVRWIVAEEELAGALRKMFTDAELPIEVIHVPPTPLSP